MIDPEYQCAAFLGDQARKKPQRSQAENSDARARGDAAQINRCLRYGKGFHEGETCRVEIPGDSAQLHCGYRNSFGEGARRAAASHHRAQAAAAEIRSVIGA
jgi:hypothetical protein